jgi:hypothetical protein
MYVKQKQGGERKVEMEKKSKVPNYRSATITIIVNFT